MIIGIDPKVDYGFKHVFGRETTRTILIDVLDSVLVPDTGHEIREIELMNPLNPKEALDDKLSILDVKARDQTGRQFNVEMQMLAFRHYEKRILYYWAKLHQQQFHQGSDYLELKPTVSVSFLDHVLFPEVPGHHLCFRLLEEAHQIPLTKDMEFHILELPKFTKPCQGFDKWLGCLALLSALRRENGYGSVAGGIHAAAASHPCPGGTKNVIANRSRTGAL